MQGGLRIANLFKLSNEGMWKRYNFADLERDAGSAHGASEYPQVWDAAAASSERDHVVRAAWRLGMHANSPRAAQTRSLPPSARSSGIAETAAAPGREGGRVRGASDS